MSFSAQMVGKRVKSKKSGENDLVESRVADVAHRHELNSGTND